MTDTRSATDPTVRELPLAAGGDLELRLGSNRLRVRVTDGDRVVIRGRTDHDLERDVEITSGEGWVRVTDGPAGSLRVGPVTVRSGGHTPDLDVDVPRNVRISARTLSGDIDAIGIAGPSRWQSASGRVRVGAESGPLSVETVSGGVLVDARSPLAVTARTVSGSVRVGAPRLTASDVATTSGDITLDAALEAGTRHVLTSVSGDVRLITGSEVTVELQSITGDIRATQPHRVDGVRGRRTVVVGSGRVRVEVRTMSGDVELSPGAPDDATGAPTEAAENADPEPRTSFWAEFSRDWADVGRDWAEWAKDWASWGSSWAAGKGWAAPRGPKAPAAPRPPAHPGRPTAPQMADAAASPVAAPASGATAAGAPEGTPGPADAAGTTEPASPVGAVAAFAAPGQAADSEPDLDETAPVPALSPADIEAARLEVLRLLERGELDVATAAERLAALEGTARHEEA